MKRLKCYHKILKNRKYNTWCKYISILDTYGCGCQHDCRYCYARALLSFRGFWNAESPSVSNIGEIYRVIKRTPKNTVFRLGCMTDCFQPVELIHKVTYDTIKLLNQYKINYLITSKSALVSSDEYLEIYDKNLAHFQISITNTNDDKCLEYENASKISDRIKSIEKLYSLGFDVSIRLSPFIHGYIDFNILNNINCNKILVEYLKVNHWIKRRFNIDYSKYTLSYGGYLNLTLREKKEQLKNITGFKQLSVGEYVHDHHRYFKNNVNYNKEDCCNINIKNIYLVPIQQEMNLST